MIIFFTIALSFFLVWTVINSFFLPALPKSPKLQNEPLVSILVPLRNEAANVPGLIASIKELSYKNINVFLLEDHSTDETLALLLEHTKGLPYVHVIEGEPLPPAWVGKVFGCHQLSQLANGDYLLFIDADVRLEKNTIEAALALATSKGAALVTGFSRFPTHTILGNLLIPMQHFVVSFHLPLFMANYTNKPQFTAAHGAFMLFEKNSYNKIGGHLSVKSSLVEDVEITRMVKKANMRAILANVTEYVSCNMYVSSKDVWQGFTKNIFPGLGRSYLLAFSLINFYATFYILPLFLAVLGVISKEWLYIAPLFLSLMQRMWIDFKARQRLTLFVLMPFSALSLIIILIASIIRNMTNKGYQWKGRNYS